MHGLNTPFSTTWFLAPYCAWLGYGQLSRVMNEKETDFLATYLNGGFIWMNRDKRV